jgi:ketosteroid isomerase-like protein
MEPTEVVRELFAAFARRDPAALEPIVHEDCQFWPQGTAEAIGRTEPYAGPDGVRQFLVDTEAVWDELEVHPTDVRAAGSGVVCFGVAIGRLKGSPDAQRIPVIWVFRLQQGRLVYGRAVRTAAEARELVGPDASDAAGAP